MAVIVAIQETTVAPAGDGLRVLLYVSDKPPAEEEAAAFALTLQLQIDRRGTGRLKSIQRRPLEEMIDALKLLMSSLYDQDD